MSMEAIKVRTPTRERQKKVGDVERTAELRRW